MCTLIGQKCFRSAYWTSTESDGWLKHERKAKCEVEWYAYLNSIKKCQNAYILAGLWLYNNKNKKTTSFCTSVWKIEKLKELKKHFFSSKCCLMFFLSPKHFVISAGNCLLAHLNCKINYSTIAASFTSNKITAVKGSRHKDIQLHRINNRESITEEWITLHYIA